MTTSQRAFCSVLPCLLIALSAPSAHAQGYRELAAVPWQNNMVDLFAIDSDGSVEHRSQREPNGDFSRFEELGAVASDIAALALADGRYEVFIVDDHQALWHNWQPAGRWDWNGWEQIDDATKQVAVARAPSGRVELFVIGSDDAVWHRGRDSDAADFGSWYRLELSGTQLAASGADTGFELAVIGSDAALWQLSFSESGESIGDPQNLGGESFDVGLAQLPGGGHSLVAVGTESSVWERRRSSLEQGWDDWQSLALQARRAALVETSAGLALFALSADDHLQHLRLTAADVSWSEPQTLSDASPLDSELQGNARLIIPSLDVNQAVPITIGLRFSVDRTRVAVTSFPTVVTESFDTPFGATTSTVSLPGSGTGELQRDAGVLRLPVTLHFDQSLDLPFIEEDGNLSLTLSSDAPDGQLLDRTTGAVALSGNASFQGDGSTNPLDGQDCQVILTGTITPVP